MRGKAENINYSARNNAVFSEFDGIEPIWISLVKAGYIHEALIKLVRSHSGAQYVKLLILKDFERRVRE